MVKVGAAQNTVVHMYAFPCCQQSHERAAQRAAVGGPYMPAAVFQDVGFDFFGFCKHCRKFGTFCFVKAIIADAKYAKIPLQQRDHLAKVAFPVAAGAGQQQNDRSGIRPKFINLHSSASRSHSHFALRRSNTASLFCFCVPQCHKSPLAQDMLSAQYPCRWSCHQ